MKFHKNKLLTTVSAIALVLAVGACSSSSDDEMALVVNGDGDAANGDDDAANGDDDAANGDDDAANGDDDAKTPAETLADARAALAELPADATVEAEEMAQELVDVALRLPGNEAELIASLDAKVAQAEERQSVLDLTEQERQTNADELQNAETALANASAEDKEAAQAAVDEALQMPGNEAALMASLDALIASLEQQVYDAAQAKKVADAAEAAKKDSAMATAVLEAIGRNTVLAAAPAVKLAASSAGVLTAKRTGYTMSAAPEEIAGWRGRTLENDDGDTTVIYTNIADSVATKIGKIYGAASAPEDPAAHYDVTADDDVMVDMPTEHDIPWSKVKRADDLSATAGAGEDAKTTFAGSVRGLAGTFSCAGACTPPPPDEATGAVTSTDDWTFTPTDPEGTIDVADSAYISFGWWLNAMGTMGAYDFDAFASAPGMTARAVLPGMVAGSATYKGAAAGKWAMQSTSDDSASGGHFTATATLTADFDANTAVDDQVNEAGVSIGGSITDFMTGDVSRPNWKVTLTAPAADTDITTDAGVSGKTSWTTGGAVSGEGDWNAIFYGGMQDDQPAAAAGEFEAAIPASGEIGRISGAFGATKVPE